MTKKRMRRIALWLLLAIVLISIASIIFSFEAAGTSDIQLGIDVEDVESEILDGELEELAILIHAEAGNQDFEGRCLVGEVVMNRIRDPRFPDTIHEVIFQRGQFSCINDGGYTKACWNVENDDFRASRVVWDRFESGKLHTEALYFSIGSCKNGTFLFKHGAHYFGK